MSTTSVTPTVQELEELYTYEAPAFAEMEETERSHVAQFVAVIAVILAFFASVLAWCYFVCRSDGGLAACEVGWYQAKAICKE